MTRSLIVDGTKEVIANGRAITMHAISKPTDYTHQRIVGFAVSLEDAHLFAAAEEMRDVVADMLSGLKYLRDTNSVPYGFGIDRLGSTGTAALSKSETR